ncbi:hypothetical protein JCM8202_004713 [Rhodotorula sphaerocarpa]
MAGFEPSDPTYGFPFSPYKQQEELMAHLYRAMATGQVTVIESPTGTGKSLSIISSSLSYLRDAKAHARTDLVASIRASVADSDSFKDEPDWVIEHEIKTKLDDLDRQERELEERLAKIREREREENARLAQAGRQSLARKRQKIEPGEEAADAEEQFAPTPYVEGEDLSGAQAIDQGVAAEDNYSPAVKALLNSLSGKSRPREEEDEPDVQKIYFVSRTHSQLSQFVAELRKTAFARAGTDLNPAGDDAAGSPDPPSAVQQNHPVRVIPLGSRQNLCINDDVRRKAGGSNDALGDLCVELQKAGKERCPYLPPLDEPAKLNAFRDKALASVHDIEDIEDLGRKMHTCPYYGSRKAVRVAEVVTLPYNLLMQKSAREALGISLKNHVVVVDEAHNLIDSVLALHSVSITTGQLRTIRQALLTYIQKFRSRFTGLNATYLKQFAVVLKTLSENAETWAKQEKHEEMVEVGKVLGATAGGAVDQIDLRKLDEYLQRSKIARKIGGYVDHLAQEKQSSGRQQIRNDATRALHQIQHFILCLANASRDGRVLLTQDQQSKPAHDGAAPNVTLKYLLLAPADSFRDVAEEARAVVLAGGTMAPMSDFREQLFPYLPSERFSTFSCGHVVSQEQVFTSVVSKGPSGTPLTFTYSTRKDEKLLDELGQALINIAALTPKGMVVFVPSYDFLAQVQLRWAKTGTVKRLAAKKEVFWEPKATADVDAVLREYAAGNVGSSKGCVLFAVVGAKLSEGINFADDMARAVVVCGIPYPNSQSAELKERMAYLRKTSSGTGDAGQVLYQNLAFRAVNQSIGRAIRNARDWAAVILLDERYAQQSKLAQLPGWLGSDVQTPTSFGALVKSLAGFYRSMQA